MKKLNYLNRLCFAIILFLLADTLIGILFLKGANERYGLTRNSQILLIGHSHLMLASNEDVMQQRLGVKISKYTREGVNVADRQKMVKQYLDSKYSDSLKLVLYGVDLCTFTGGKSLADNSYTLFYPFMNNTLIAEYIKSQTTCENYYARRLVKTYRFSDDGIKNGCIRGLLHDNRNLNKGKIDVNAYKAKLSRGDERHIKMDEDLMKIFDETIRSITARGVRVVLVNTPTLDLLNEFEPNKFQDMVQWFQQYADSNEMVEYWDFNPQFSSCHELFMDRLHLNVEGQSVITEELIKKIEQIKL